MSDEPQIGIYMGCRVSEQSTKELRDYAVQHGVPNLKSADEVKDKRLHATILDSRIGNPADIKGNPGAVYLALGTLLDKFGTCLVLKLSCPALMRRHRELMSEHNLAYVFPVYVPHVTLSYDIGDFDWTTIPPYTNPIILEQEYVEELKT